MDCIVTPNFHFNGECEKALKVYKQALNGEITVFLRYEDANPSDYDVSELSAEELKYVYHAEMIIGQQRVMFSDTFRDIPKGENLSMVVTFKSGEQVRKAYARLIEGGQVIVPVMETTYSSCFASLKDRFGNRWELMTEDR